MAEAGGILRQRERRWQYDRLRPITGVFRASSPLAREAMSDEYWQSRSSEAWLPPALHVCTEHLAGTSDGTAHSEHFP